MTKYKLTEEENDFWEETFSYYIDHGYSPGKADKLAFTELKKRFPRFRNLKKTDKII